MPYKSVKVAILNSDQQIVDRLHAVTCLSGYSVCVSTSKHDEIDRALREQPVDLLIADVAADDKSSFLSLRRWRAKYSSLQLLVFCGFKCDKAREMSSQLGVRYHFSLGDPLEIFIGATRKLLQSRLQQLSTLCASDSADGGNDLCISGSINCVREQEIFELLGAGYSRKEISGKLNLSPRTVDSYLIRLKMNVGVSSTRQLVRLAMLSKDAEAVSNSDWVPYEWPVRRKS
ncbi:MAG: hypothetical protein CVV41_19430 [Candidatus Riflebacteria bacterium HGW-Riflebacteria-1]|nr:MAG: hypothetical protein CVV41_19430 [Candidatus Riflebacteria bacterium HGW-Riflebacteria-1]